MANESTPRGGEHTGGGLPPVRGQGGPGHAALDHGYHESFTTPTGLAGYALHDPLGREIGRIEQIFVNARDEPEYVAVRIGGFWRKRGVLLPVESVSVDDGRRVLVLR